MAQRQACPWGIKAAGHSLKVWGWALCCCQYPLGSRPASTWHPNTRGLRLYGMTYQCTASRLGHRAAPRNAYANVSVAYLAASYAGLGRAKETEHLVGSSNGGSDSGSRGGVSALAGGVASGLSSDSRDSTSTDGGEPAPHAQPLTHNPLKLGYCRCA